MFIPPATLFNRSTLPRRTSAEYIPSSFVPLGLLELCDVLTPRSSLRLRQGRARTNPADENRKECELFDKNKNSLRTTNLSPLLAAIPPVGSLSDLISPASTTYTSVSVSNIPRPRAVLPPATPNTLSLWFFSEPSLARRNASSPRVRARTS